jgi:hypothetical protein
MVQTSCLANRLGFSWKPNPSFCNTQDMQRITAEGR